ncbi:MAG: diguanylate cyclase [Leptospiraceae bacterium]|nr:diguanylate cyclase [Leptospiraceae bacterium]
MAEHIQILVSPLEQRAQELEQLNQSLEHKVVERTSELEDRTNQLAQTNYQLQVEIKEREQAKKALTIANQTLQRLATVDGLTQIFNRRYFDERIQHEWNRFTREREPLDILRKRAIPHENSGVDKNITISLGIACMVPSLDKSPDELIALADQALYMAKQQGRNRYRCL